MKIKLVFFATPDIALKSFKELITSDEFEVCALVTQPPKASGRGKKIALSGVKKLAIEHNIDVIEPVKISKEPELIEKLKSYNADFFVTFAFGQILSQEILDIPRFETINLHASLLPKYRGANPICECLLQGDSVTGITTMITVLELDAGDICMYEEIKLDKDTSYPDLAREIADKAPDLIKKTLKKLFENTLKPYPQDNSHVSFTKKMKKEEKVINFNADADFLHNKIRAFCGINTCHFLYKNKIIKVLKSAVIGIKSNCKQGEVIDITKEGLIVKCKNNAVIIKTVKPEGKGEMSAYCWSLGSKIKKGDII